MGRLRFSVTLIFVLSALYRFNDEKFILQSFRGHGTSRGNGTALSEWELPPADDSKLMVAHLPRPNWTAPKYSDYEVGQFCVHCSYDNGEKMCADRAEFLETRYKMSKAEARNSPELLRTCKTPPLPRKVHAEEDEPSIIIHAGPHKTGTTALQAFIYDLAYTNETLFTFDNIRIPTYEELPGVYAKEGVMLNLAHCALKRFKRSGGNMNKGMCARMRAEFPKFMIDAYNKSQDVLFVAEDFDRDKIDYDRLRFYLQPYKKIKVVSMYRRMHDWLPSWYNQIIDHYVLVYAKLEEHFPTFAEWLEERYSEFLQAHAIPVAERYRKQRYTDTVDIINMHAVAQNGDLIEHFFCQHLRARAICQAIKEGATPSKSNIGSEHEWERLALKASFAGVISADLTKPLNLGRAARHLKSRVAAVNASVPVICPNRTLLEQILQTEIEQERKYFPDWFDSQGGEGGMRKAFESAVKKKFCSFDVDKIFAADGRDPILHSAIQYVQKNCMGAERPDLVSKICS